MESSDVCPPGSETFDENGSVRMRPAAAVVFLGLLTACAEKPATPAAGDSTSTRGQTNPKTVLPSAEPSVPPNARPSVRGTTVVAADSDFGTILFDDTGQAIYLFDAEGTSRPRCYGPCAHAWPPVVTEGLPRAGEHVRAALLGRIQRADGTSQVTYDGHPLYFYAHEGKHDVECHDVFMNGGNWYAVRPDGRPA